MDSLIYKGYYTKIHYSEEDKVLFGKIEGINDLVNFESESAQEIETEFHKAVDDYLAYCEGVGKSPEKPYKGSFNVRLSPEMHRMLAEYAIRNNTTLNAVVTQAMKEYAKREGFGDE